MNASQWGKSNRRDSFLEAFKNSKDALNAQLTGILNTLKWDLDELEQKFNESELLRICPFNPLHRVPEKSYDAHCRNCELAHYGIKSDTKSKLPSSMFFYADAPSVVSLVDRGILSYTYQSQPSLSRHTEHSTLNPSNPDPAMASIVPSPQNIIHVTSNPVPQPPVGYIPTVNQRDAVYLRDLELADRLRAERRVAKREEYPF
ncbi:hypothetical protein BC937DRAFT_87878 [Endogone sp. FLAS-F59071]|nr:hypothetical protein BC937DRAFT_87878 [Endogone sp. FLAS-F59071]|eukprot:RUS22679.1 hypothetical protein BC937DRAFT_87878 [Endogone sp. FLAS-F59071]